MVSNLSGTLYLIAPQMMLATPAIQLHSVNEYHLVRSAYGGGFLGLAALFGIGARVRSLEKSSLLAIASVLSGFAFGRLYSIAVDGIPTPLFLAVLGFEVFFAALAVIVLRAQRLLRT